MSKYTKINTPTADTVRDLLSKLLHKGKIGGVFSLRRLPSGTVDYGLFTNPEDLQIIEPFYPLMPLNAGQVLSRFTPMDKPVAAVIRPCEFRAFVEMVKREQVRMEDFFIITSSCSGVYPLQKQAAQKIDKNLDDYYQAVENMEIPPGVRDVCTACEYIYHPQADVFISLAGNSPAETELYLQSSRSEKLLGEYLSNLEEAEFDQTRLEGLLKKRKAGKEKLFKQIDTSESGLDGLIDIFGKCIGCHGCNSVCPICYCTLCDFDSHNYDYNRTILEKELAEKGALRLPPDTLFFHLGRLSHMSFSCVGCGMCSDVCPANIPVASVFKRTGEETAAIFDFVAGRNTEEEIPVMIFKEEEFPELGE